MCYKQFICSFSTAAQCSQQLDMGKMFELEIYFVMLNALVQADWDYSSVSLFLPFHLFSASYKLIIFINQTGHIFRIEFILRLIQL